MTKEYSGKVALVTGASSGIGKAAAIAFAKKGAHVAIAARRADELDAVLTEIRDVGGSGAAIPTDISQPDQIESLVRRTVDLFGRLDVAFNNAGVMGNWAPLTEQSCSDFDAIINVNLRGTWLCCREEIDQMMRQGSGGAIVNTSSWLSNGALIGSTLYSMSKAGLDGMTRALALEAGAVGIRVNSINPGVIDTEMLRSNTDDTTRQPFAAHTPLKRFGTAQEAAEVAVWLGSDAGRFVTGQCILVDGGYAIAGNRS